MPSLYDLLNSKQLKALASSTIAIGNVVRCFVRNTKPPKVKRFIVLGKSSDGHLLGIVFINSSINFNVLNSQELLDLQYQIQASSNNFLTHDSNVDCSKIIKMAYSDIEAAVIKNPNCVIGSVRESDLEAILNNVKNSDNNSEILLEELGIS